MKLLFLYALIVLFPCILVSQNNQTVEIVYVKGYKNYKDLSDDSPKILKNLEYKMLCTSIESIFEFIPIMVNDADEKNKRFISRGGGKGIYYKNLETKNKLWKINIFDQNFIVQVDLNKFKWELLKSEVKTIIGYQCLKAIGTYEEYSPMRKKTITNRVEVWYTPSIPLSFGPAGFDGLPGLVLESNTGSFYLIAKEIKFHKSKIKIDTPKKGKKVNIFEFNNLLFEGFENYTNNR